MQVRLEDGNVVTVPDSVKTQADLQEFLAMQKEPGLVQRVAGNLQLGVHDLAEGLGNLATTIGMGGPGQVLTDIAEGFGGMESARRVEAHPATSMPGQIAEGLVRFLPEVPLWAAGEGVVMRGATALPKIGKFAEKLMSPSAKAVEAGLAAPEGILKGTVKAAARAGLTGGALGPLLAKPDASFEERMHEGWEEAKGFAMGVGILHPAFMVLRKAVGKAIGKRRGITDADVNAAMEDPATAEKILKDKEAAELWKDYREMQEAQRDVTWNREAYGGDEPIGFGVEGASSGENITRVGEQGELFPGSSTYRRRMPVEPVTAEPVRDPNQMELDFNAPAIQAELTGDRLFPQVEGPALRPEGPELPERVLGGPTGQAELDLRIAKRRRKKTETPPAEGAPIEPPKKISIKYVTDEQAQALVQSGMKVEDIQAKVKEVVDSVPQRERLIDRRLLGYAYKREDLAKMTKEQKVEALKKEEVDAALTEMMRGAEPSAPRSLQPERTPEELQRIAAEQEANIRRMLQERESKQGEKLKELGHTEEEIAQMSPEQRTELIDKGVQVKAKKAVEKVQSGEKVTEEDIAELEAIAEDAKLAEKEDKFDFAAAQKEEREVIMSHWREFFSGRKKSTPSSSTPATPKPGGKPSRRNREEARQQKELEELMDAYKGAEGQLAKATAEGNQRLMDAMKERMDEIQKGITALLDKKPAPAETKTKRRAAKTEDLRVPEAADDAADWEARLKDEGLGEIDSEFDAEGNPKELDFDLGFMGTQYAQKIYEAFKSGEFKNASIRLLKDQSGKITFHGTKKKFDRFLDEFIGSGEGAQVYGYGHYLTSKRQVAHWYAENIGSQRSTNINVLESEFARVTDNLPFKEKIDNKLINDIYHFLEGKHTLSSAILRSVNDAAKYMGLSGEHLDLLRNRLHDMDSSKIIQRSKVVHEVHIPDDAEWLDLDRVVPANQRNKVVNHLDAKIQEMEIYISGYPNPQSAMRPMELVNKLKRLKDSLVGESATVDEIKEFYDRFLNRLERGGTASQEDIGRLSNYPPFEKLRHLRTVTRSNMGGGEPAWFRQFFTPEELNKIHFKAATGETLQRELQDILGNKNASLFLKEAGIPGNTYIGPSSGERNYVIFDENLPQIRKTYMLESGGFQTIYEAALKFARRDGEHPAERILKTLQGDANFNLRDLRSRGDIAPWSEYYRQPMQLAKQIGQKAYDLVYNLNKADHLRKWQISQDFTLFRNIQTKLTPAEQVKLTKILDGKEKAANEKEAKAAAEMRNYLDMMWEERKKTRLAEFKSHLTKDEWEAVDSIINKGMDEGAILSKFKDVDKDVLKKLIEDYKQIGKGFVKDYVPKVERGTIVIRTAKEDGKPGGVIAVALNTDDAVRKALAFKERNADYKGDLFIDTNFKGLEQSVGLTKAKYWKVVNQLAKTIDKELKEINEGIESSISRTAARRGVKKVFTLKPTDKFSAFDQPRHDILQGEENIFDILHSYAYSMRTKNALDPVITESRRTINTDYAGKPNVQKFLTNVVEDTKGRYWSEDKQLDAIMKMMGKEDASMTATKIAGQVREVEGALKLGYRPISALFNRLGGAANTWVKVGTDIYLEARQFVKTPEGKKFLQEMDPYKGISMSHEATGELKTADSIWHPMGLFEKPELPNRNEGIAANYIYAKRQLGMDEAAAREFAIRENWFQQTTYNMANLPRLLRSPTGRVMGQFKTYLVNQLEFIASLRGPEVGRYMIAQIALGGPRGAVALMKSLPVLAAFTPWWDELEEYMNKNYPAAYRGIGGALGVDATGPATMQVPSKMEDFLGPALSDVVSTYSEIIKPYINREKPAPSSVMGGLSLAAEALGNIAPVVRYWPKLIVDKIAHPTQDGFIIKDDRGREVYRLKESDYWKEVMGAEPLEPARVRIEESILNRRDRALQKRKAHIVDVLMDAMESGGDVPDNIWDEMVELNIKPASIKREAKMRSLPPDVRRLMRTELSRRYDVSQSYPLPED